MIMTITIILSVRTRFNEAGGDKKKEKVSLKQRQSRGQEKVSLKLFHALIKNGQTA
jgi:hypothetical protein